VQAVSATTKPACERVASDAPLRVLVAEDNLVNQMVAIMQLKKLGYAADLAVDGVEVLKALEKVPYDVILMDCQMPNMDGLTATREIRRIHARPIRIVAMTGNSTAEDCANCLAAGMDDFLCKPVDTRDLGRLMELCERVPEVSAMNLAVEPIAATNAPVDLNRLLEFTGYLPEMFQQLARDYLAQADEILEGIVMAIERRSAEDLRYLAHKLGGSSSSCGMRAIVDPLRRLEQIGVTSQFSLAHNLYQDAMRQLSRIRNFLSRYLQSHFLMGCMNTA
jgi:CheY-like chemotaxis protein